MLRMILAVLGGWFAGTILTVGTDHIFHVTNVYPPYGDPMLDDGLLRAVITILACYLAAMWSKDRANQAAWILGILSTVAWLGGTIAMWEYAQPWYNILGIVTSIPLALAGAGLYRIRAGRRGRIIQGES
jgi:hypothetical protein